MLSAKIRAVLTGRLHHFCEIPGGRRRAFFMLLSYTFRPQKARRNKELQAPGHQEPVLFSVILRQKTLTFVLRH
jgi:hypothetical protein